MAYIRDLTVNVKFSNSLHRIVAWPLTVKLPSGECHRTSVNIGSGNGLVPTGNKPLPEAMLRLMSPYGVSRPQWVKLFGNNMPPKDTNPNIDPDDIQLYHSFQICLFFIFYNIQHGYYHSFQICLFFIFYNIQHGYIYMSQFYHYFVIHRNLVIVGSEIFIGSWIWCH